MNYSEDVQLLHREISRLRWIIDNSTTKDCPKCRYGQYPLAIQINSLKEKNEKLQKNIRDLETQQRQDNKCIRDLERANADLSKCNYGIGQYQMDRTVLLRLTRSLEDALLVTAEGLRNFNTRHYEYSPRQNVQE
jgi:myosin heavy subunit